MEEVAKEESREPEDAGAEHGSRPTTPHPISLTVRADLERGCSSVTAGTPLWKGEKTGCGE